MKSSIRYFFIGLSLIGSAIFAFAGTEKDMVIRVIACKKKRTGHAFMAQQSLPRQTCIYLIYTWTTKYLMQEEVVYEEEL
jgi:hypothetical protein